MSTFVFLKYPNRPIKNYKYVSMFLYGIFLLYLLSNLIYFNNIVLYNYFEKFIKDFPRIDLLNSSFLKFILLFLGLLSFVEITQKLIKYFCQENKNIVYFSYTLNYKAEVLYVNDFFTSNKTRALLI